MNENLENRCVSLRDEALQQSAPSGANIDKVIACLDYCGGDSPYCDLCPYDNYTFCKYSLMKDASTLLKQYKAIKPLIDDIS